MTPQLPPLWCPSPRAPRFVGDRDKPDRQPSAAPPMAIRAFPCASVSRDLVTTAALTATDSPVQVTKSRETDAGSSSAATNSEIAGSVTVLHPSCRTPP